MTTPLAQLFESIEPYIGQDDQAEWEARQRLVDAREIRDRLPLMLRTPPPRELLQRVSYAPFRDAVQRWTDAKGSVVFTGATGLGKTTAIAWLFRRLLGEGVRNGGAAWDRAQSLRWFAAADLERAKETHKLGHGEAPELIEACHSRILFLDDLGWEKHPKVVADILDFRYERGWSTVVTSGKDLSQLRDFYGAAVVRRLVESGKKPPVVVMCKQEAKAAK